jgi:hypothetical protein
VSWRCINPDRPPGNRQKAFEQVNFKTIIAIDWSGSQKEADQRRKIWACQATIDRQSIVLDSLQGGRTRQEIVEWLNSVRADREPLAVGFDFAFSFPAGFHGHEGFSQHLSGKSWLEFLYYAETHGEEILDTCPRPFWGKADRKRPNDATLAKYSSGQWLRLTDRPAGARSPGPKEIFQIGGAGNVGTGSLRGLPILAELRSSGWPIWPFDQPADSAVVEIYPGCLYNRPVRKTDLLDREAYLKAIDQVERPHITVTDRWVWARAAASDDAFDAFISCIAMAKAEAAGGLFANYQIPVHQQVAVEGWIWGHDCWPMPTPA